MQICAENGTAMQSCQVNQTFRFYKIKNGLPVKGWVDGPLSCSCKEPPRRPWIVPETERSRSPAVSPKCDCIDPVECATH